MKYRGRKTHPDAMQLRRRSTALRGSISDYVQRAGEVTSVQKGGVVESIEPEFSDTLV